MSPQLDVVRPEQPQYAIAGYYPLADWTPILGWGIALIGLAAVAAAARQVVKAILGNPIPYEVRRELEDKYGRWAVQTAIKVCPLDDIECIKREAERLYESRILRRR
jgi:hypothetical protein